MQATSPTLLKNIKNKESLMRLVAIFAFLAPFAFASNYDHLFKEYGEHFGTPPALLKNIAKIESSLNPNCVNKNKNGTVDYGIMQINSVHFQELKKYGINESNIMNPKVNIMAGAILLKNILKNGELEYDQIGKYHSKTPYFKSLWVQKLDLELQKNK